MAPVHTIQPTFTGGEFAPSLHSRVDLQKHATGLKRAKNMFVHAHGGASNRPGTYLVREVKDSTKQTRIVDFEFSEDQAYAIEFGHEYVRFHTDGGTVLSGGSPYEVVTPYTESELAGLKFAQSADVLYVVHPDHAPRTLSRYADSPPDWRLELFEYENGPFMLSNATAANTLTLGAVSGAGVTLVASVDTFDSDHVGALFRIRHSMQGEAYTNSFTATGNGTGLNCGGTWRISTRGTWAGTLKVEKSIDGGSNWTMLRQFTSKSDYNINTFGTDDGPFLVRLNMSAFSSGTCEAELTTDPYEHTGIVEIATVVDAQNATCDVLTRAGSTTATWDWAEGSWSDVNGWPATVGFYQERLGFAATYSEPQAVWLSQSGNYTDFGRSDPILDTDGISINLPSRKLNAIRNLVGLQDIIAFTSSTDWTISAAAGGAITPTSVESKLHGYRGSNGVDPAVVGNRVIYVQPMGSVVRDLGFDYQTNGFTGDNLSVFSNHLFTGYSIVELAYQQEPESLVWAVRSDGKLLSMTYVREQEITAWTWHETDGEVESICCIPADGFDELWMVVKRGSSRFIERMVQRMASEDPQDQFFVDCGLTYDDPKTITAVTSADPAVVTSASHGFSNGDLVDISDITWTENDDEEQPDQLNGNRYEVANAAANTFELIDVDTGEAVDSSEFLAYVSGGYARKVVTSVSGLSHLNGETVAILGNGDVYPQQVVSGGSITLSPGASRVHVGLPYESDLQTLPVELRLPSGTSQDRKIHIPSVTIHFLNSRGGWLGPDEDHLDEYVQRTGEPLGSPISLFTGKDEQPIAGGYQRDSSVFFRQVDPLPVTILAVIPKVEPGG